MKKNYSSTEFGDALKNSDKEIYDQYLLLKAQGIGNIKAQDILAKEYGYSSGARHIRRVIKRHEARNLGR